MKENVSSHRAVNLQCNLTMFAFFRIFMETLLFLGWISLLQKIQRQIENNHHNNNKHHNQYKIRKLLKFNLDQTTSEEEQSENSTDNHTKRQTVFTVFQAVVQLQHVHNKMNP